MVTKFNQALDERGKHVQLGAPFDGRPLELPFYVKMHLDMVRPPKDAGIIWTPRPFVDEPVGPVALWEFHANKVDPRQSIGELLMDKSIDGAVNLIDLSDGCRNNCGVCVRDVKYPKQMFDGNKFLDLLNDERFITVLNNSAIEFGYASDVADNPMSPQILRKIHDKTTQKDERARKNQRRHVIRYFSNYRKSNESLLDELIDLAKSSDRFQFVLSIPWNGNDIVSRQFLDFAGARQDVLGKFKLDHGKIIQTNDGIENIIVHDISSNELLLSGRQLPKDQMLQRDPKILDGYEDEALRSCGGARLVLNPQGLWINVSVDPKTSYTCAMNTRLTPENIRYLQQIPHLTGELDLPNWGGGCFMPLNRDMRDIIRERAQI